MTANGFVSVSLSPPTVLVAVMPGRMHRTLATSGRHCVNVLPEGGHGLSPYFAGRTDYRNPYYGIVDGHTRLTGCLAFSRAN